MIIDAYKLVKKMNYTPKVIQCIFSKFSTEATSRNIRNIHRFILQRACRRLSPFVHNAFTIHRIEIVVYQSV